MQDQEQLNVVESFLLRYGIDIGFLVSGFFGALLLVSKNSAQKLSATIASILAGTACANYLTPVVMSVLPDSIKNGGKYAVAFVMGFMGLKGLELIIEKYMAKHDASLAAKAAAKAAAKKTKSRAKKPKVQ